MVLKVSVLICTYNDGNYLEKCIRKILNQSFKNIELIIINDGSIDNTDDIVNSFKDKRIKYFRFDENIECMGKIRNFAVSKSKGDYLFFIDADCYAPRDWIKNGLKAFKKTHSPIIEGKTIYYKENYKPSLSDKCTSNEFGNKWLNCNLAFKKEVFDKLNYNISYPSLEDSEIVLRIIKIYNISVPFVDYFLVYHVKKKRTVIGFIKESKRWEQKVRLIKNIGGNKTNKFQILNPRFFLVAIFPPAILLEFFYNRIRGLDDLKLLPFLWVKAVYMRFLIWKTAFKEGIFVI